MQKLLNSPSGGVLPRKPVSRKSARRAVACGLPGSASELTNRSQVWRDESCVPRPSSQGVLEPAAPVRRQSNRNRGAAEVNDISRVIEYLQSRLLRQPKKSASAQFVGTTRCGSHHTWRLDTRRRRRTRLAPADWLQLPVPFPGVFSGAAQCRGHRAMLTPIQQQSPASAASSPLVTQSIGRV